MFSVVAERWKTFTLKTIAGMQKDQTNQIDIHQGTNRLSKVKILQTDRRHPRCVR